MLDFIIGDSCAQLSVQCFSFFNDTFWLFIVIYIFFVLKSYLIHFFPDHRVMADPFDIQGPSFTIEPPHHLEFTNIVDNLIPCQAKGSPKPKIEWLHHDNTPVTTIPRVSIVYVHKNLTNKQTKSVTRFVCGSHTITKINSIEIY